MKWFKVSYEGDDCSDVIVAYFCDERFVFDFMELLVEKLNRIVFVQLVDEPDKLVMKDYSK